MRERRDTWAVGDAYERYMGRWSRAVAERFVVGLGCRDGLRWLDVGCGTGALTAVVTARCRPSAVVAIDRSSAFVASARDTVPAPAYCVRGDALSLPVGDRACDVAVSGLALNFLPTPGAAVAEAVRVVRPGGLVAAYVWDYAEGMTLLRCFWDAAISVDPSAAALDEGRRFPLCRPGRLRTLWAEAGLAEVRVAPVEVPTVFAGFTELWDPFLGGQGPAAGYATALAPVARDRLRDVLRATVPTRQDGSIALTARAWAVRGRRP